MAENSFSFPPDLLPNHRLAESDFQSYLELNFGGLAEPRTGLLVIWLGDSGKQFPKLSSFDCLIVPLISSLVSLAGNVAQYEAHAKTIETTLRTSVWLIEWPRKSISFDPRTTVRYSFHRQSHTNMKMNVFSYSLHPWTIAQTRSNNDPNIGLTSQSY